LDEPGTTTTFDTLISFGFLPDPEVISEDLPGLSFSFGNFKLSVSFVMSRWFSETVLCTGILKSERTIADVSFEMPRRVICCDQCAAWIVWHLDQCAGGLFQPLYKTPWLLDGRKNLNLLPWVAEMAEYNARPKCVVQRPWLRLALKSLADVMAATDDASQVLCGFDGNILKIICAGEVIALPAEGTAWGKQFAVPVGELRRLPKKMMDSSVEVSIRKNRLFIGRNCYEGATIAEAES
jgi:hypothetical protein